MLHIDPGNGTIARTDPFVLSISDTTTAGGQLMTKGFLTRIPIQFIIPEWVDTNYPIKAKTLLFLGNTSPSGAGQQVEMETNFAWNGDNSNYFTATGTKATATIKNISNYSVLDYVEVDLGAVIDARSASNGDMIHGVIKRDATPSNFLDDDYPDAVSPMDIEFTARVKRGYEGEFE